jgi:sigma-B regulation protein RsbU (phosphoserine phosphatase)
VFEVLNQNPDTSVVDTLSNIRIAVDEFVKDADQFDDLTMLCMQYNGPLKQEEE